MFKIFNKGAYKMCFIFSVLATLFLCTEITVHSAKIANGTTSNLNKNVKTCAGRDYNHGSVVCVCNATYCDAIEPVHPEKTGKYVIYTSNKDGMRYQKKVGEFQKGKTKKTEVLVTLDQHFLFQTILGFGGAFTDSASFNIQSLKGNVKQNLLKSYFSNQGNEYSLCRVSIGCSDFSMNYYSYDEEDGDVDLKHFNLTKEDYLYKIPLMQEALKLSSNNLRFFGSTWTPPLWMKTNQRPSGFGLLKKEYYQTWANYHVKFLDAYKQNGLDFWGITTGNEPVLGLSPFFEITSLGWFPWDQGKWVAENLGPTIKNNPKYSDLKIIAVDDERLMLPTWMILMTLGNNSTKYIDGIGVHWYTDQLFPFLLSFTQFIYPQKFILGTEACAGDLRYKQKVVLGNWRRGEEYVEDIIEDLENSVTGWVEWNLALNLKGGPTYISNFVDASIIVNASAQEFYKQPTFYTIGHFSKFIPTNSSRIWSETNSKSLKTIAFVRPDKGIVVIVYNRHGHTVHLSINDSSRGFINTEILPRSVNTILFW